MTENQYEVLAQDIDYDPADIDTEDQHDNKNTQHQHKPETKYSPKVKNNSKKKPQQKNRTSDNTVSIDSNATNQNIVNNSVTDTCNNNIGKSEEIAKSRSTKQKNEIGKRGKENKKSNEKSIGIHHDNKPVNSKKVENVQDENQSVKETINNSYMKNPDHTEPEPEQETVTKIKTVKSKPKNVHIVMKQTPLDDSTESSAFRKRILNNILGPLFEDMNLIFTLATDQNRRVICNKLLKLHMKTAQYEEKLKKAPNLKSMKVIDIELEKLFNTFIRDPDFMSLIRKKSNFYIEPRQNSLNINP